MKLRGGFSLFRHCSWWFGWWGSSTDHRGDVRGAGAPLPAQQDRCPSRGRVSRGRVHINTDSLFWSHVATLRTEASSASTARDFVRGHLIEHNQPTLVDDVRLVVSELAQLLTEQHDEDETDFTVQLLGGGGEVLLMVQDGPASFNPLVDGHITNGYDLPLTERLSERWGIDLAHIGGTVMWASFAAVGGLSRPL